MDVLVIGCGAIAQEHLKFLATDDRVRLAAVCDRSRATADYTRDQFRAGASFTDHREALAAIGPAAVHVLTPPQTHTLLVGDALDAGAHVICEKPLAATAEETDALLERARTRGKTLVESRNMLFNDVALALDALVENGRLGAVREVDIVVALDFVSGPFGDENLEGPGVALPLGAVHDFLPHLAYLLQHFGGTTDEAEVVGHVENRSGNRRIGFDHMDVLVRTPRLRGRLRLLSDVKPDIFRVTVLGTVGSAEIDFYNPYVRFQPGTVPGLRMPFEQVKSGVDLAFSGVRNFRDKVLQHGSYHGMQRMLGAIYQSFHDGTSPPISTEDMRAAARLIDRVAALGAAR